jgi:fucose permease
LKKKLVSLAKEKQCEDLQPWVKSICNHLYWVAASTPSNNRELMMEKWQTMFKTFIVMMVICFLIASMVNLRDESAEKSG